MNKDQVTHKRAIQLLGRLQRLTINNEITSEAIKELRAYVRQQEALNLNKMNVTNAETAYVKEVTSEEKKEAKKEKAEAKTDTKKESAKKKASWRRVASAIEKNDFWMSRLSFAQTKSDVKKMFELRKKYANLLKVEDADSKPLLRVAKELENERN